MPEGLHLDLRREREQAEEIARLKHEIVRLEGQLRALLDLRETLPAGAPAVPLPQLLSIADTGKLLQLHPATVRKLIESGTIPASKLGSQYRVRLDALERMMRPPEGEAR